jgi:uncharacterized membrane protein YphA (DoxX/SURF4 family)
MEKLNNLMTSMNNKTDIAYAYIRIFLGVALAIRGWIILSNPDTLVDLGVERELFIWVSLVGIAHLVGGIFLALGFFTRLAASIQIPILISAIFFVYGHTKLMMGGQSFELASLVLFLLCIYFVFGAGTLSVRDYFIKKQS